MSSRAKDAASSTASLRLRNQELERSVNEKDAKIASLLQEAAKHRPSGLKAKGKPQRPARDKDESSSEYSYSEPSGSQRKRASPARLKKKQKKHKKTRAAKVRSV